MEAGRGWEGRKQAKNGVLARVKRDTQGLDRRAHYVWGTPLGREVYRLPRLDSITSRPISPGGFFDSLWTTCDAEVSFYAMGLFEGPT